VIVAALWIKYAAIVDNIPLDMGITPTTIRPCLVAQASARGTQTSSQSLSSILPQARSSRIAPNQIRLKIQRRSPSEGSAGRRAAGLGPISLRPSDEGRSLAKPHWQGGNMTAEIAVLNKSAVALAADSTVTVGIESSQKTYDTVNKLFAMSKFHPVGIMIYGNSEVMGYPWETIIKAYRESRGTGSKPTIQLYADDFFAYLQEFKFTKDLEQANVRRILYSIFNDIRSRVGQQILASRISSRNDVRRLLLGEIRRWKRIVDTHNVLLPNKESDALAEYGNMINDAADDIFGTAVNSQITREIADFVPRLLIRDMFSPHRSGIVFAGFGDDEFFPALRGYQIDGRVLGSMKLLSGADISIDPVRNQSAIIPFAVRDMTERFMEGADRDYRLWIHSTISELFEMNSMSIIDRYVNVPTIEKSRIKGVVRRAIRRNLEQFAKDEDRYVMQKFINPVVDTIELLPKEELANLAESLVNLTYLQKTHIYGGGVCWWADRCGSDI
jgi:hypothetical protein